VGHQAHEHIEHAGHDGHSGSLARWIGMTIAILGVLLAVCSAQLGAARTELISTMVEENSAKSQYTAIANKYRMLQAQLQHLHAAMPDPELLARKDKEVNALMAEAKSRDTQNNIKACQLETDKLLNTVIPTPDDVQRFLALIDRTRIQAEAAKHWSESFHELWKCTSTPPSTSSTPCSAWRSASSSPRSACCLRHSGAWPRSPGASR
jgi:hypothetical protein